MMRLGEMFKIIRVGVGPHVSISYEWTYLFWHIINENNCNHFFLLSIKNIKVYFYFIIILLIGLLRLCLHYCEF
jgi:hypothetical protein